MNAQGVAPEVHKQYARFEARARAWMERYTARGGRVHCASGCFRCCDMPVRVSWPEALTLAAELSGEQFAAMVEHARRVWDNAHTSSAGEYVERHRREVGFCPLLDSETGRCTQYASRPTRCRDTYSGLAARFCAPGGVDNLSPQERREYLREVQTNKAMDGETHFLAPLEHLSLPAWDRFGALMRRELGFEVWGDFAFLVAMTRENAFLQALKSRDPRQVVRALKRAGLYHPEIVQID